MRGSSNNSVALVLAGLIFFILFGGVGFYLVNERQRMMAAEATEAARAQEMKARLAAEDNRAKTAAALESLIGSDHPSFPEGEDEIRTAIEAVFRDQQDAWNRGDVAAFMEHYWRSDDLTFSSGGKTTRGWKATLDRYKERYPTPEVMGRLTLGEFELFPLGDSAALVLGEWKLDRESEPVTGNFSLVLRKIAGRWVIVHDHTSRLAE